MSDKMREEFEKWALKHTTLCLDRHKTGNYMKYASNVAWAAWQAARTVPDEVLQATIDLVEGLPVHDWRNASGMRIKDHKSWVRFYCAAKNVLSAAPEGKK